MCVAIVRTRGIWNSTAWSIWDLYKVNKSDLTATWLHRCLDERDLSVFIGSHVCQTLPIHLQDICNVWYQLSGLGFFNWDLYKVNKSDLTTTWLFRCLGERGLSVLIESHAWQTLPMHLQELCNVWHQCGGLWFFTAWSCLGYCMMFISHSIYQ